MGVQVRGSQWRRRRGGVAGGSRQQVSVHRAWRWLCAFPWLAIAVLAMLSSGAHWDLLTLAVFVLIPGFVGLAIVAAPPGGWLVAVGLVASAVGILAYLIMASFAAWLGTVTGGQSHMSGVAIVILLIPLASGVGTVLLGVLDLAMGPPRGRHT